MPGDSEISREYYHYGKVYLESGEPENALEQFEAALEAEPDNPNILIGMGRARIQMKQYEKAVEHLEAAAKKAPDFADVHYHLGAVFLKLNRKEKAINEFKEALNINPGYTVAKRRLDELIAPGGRDDKKVKDKKRGMEEAERVSRQANIHFHMGNALFEKGMLSEAYEEYRQAVELRPNYPDIRNRLGELYVRRNDFNQACEEFETALEINPKYITALVNLADARRLMCDELLEKAEGEYSRALEIDPENRRAREGLEKVKAARNIDYI